MSDGCCDAPFATGAEIAKRNLNTVPFLQIAATGPQSRINVIPKCRPNAPPIFRRALDLFRAGSKHLLVIR